MQFLECFRCGKIERQEAHNDVELLCAECGSEDVQLIAEALLALRRSEEENPASGDD